MHAQRQLADFNRGGRPAAKLAEKIVEHIAHTVEELPQVMRSADIRRMARRQGRAVECHREDAVSPVDHRAHQTAVRSGADPFGGDLDLYRSTADELERMVGLVIERIATTGAT